MRKHVYAAFIPVYPGGHIGDRTAEPQNKAVLCCHIPYDDAATVAYPETWVALCAGLARGRVLSEHQKLGGKCTVGHSDVPPWNEPGWSAAELSRGRGKMVSTSSHVLRYAESCFRKLHRKPLQENSEHLEMVPLLVPLFLNTSKGSRETCSRLRVCTSQRPG